MATGGKKTTRPGHFLPTLLIISVVVRTCWGQALLDPIPRQCRRLGERSFEGKVQLSTHNQYVAGGVLMTLVSAPAGLSGVFEFYLCPEEGNKQQEECLTRLPLQLADGSGTQFNLEKVPRKDKYEIPIVLPDEFTCETCTLQWRLLMKDCKDSGRCQYRDEVFCSDISIRQVKEADKRIFRFLFGLARKAFGRYV